jgi:quinol monooxygenase YgiN
MGVNSVARSTAEPTVLRNVEVFQDQAAIGIHISTDHFKPAVEATSGYILGEPTVEICNSLH